MSSRPISNLTPLDPTEHVEARDLFVMSEYNDITDTFDSKSISYDTLSSDIKNDLTDYITQLAITVANTNSLLKVDIDKTGFSNDNNHVPGSKLTNDMKQDKSKMDTSSISNDNSKYPSSKLVYNALNEINNRLGTQLTFLQLIV